MIEIFRRPQHHTKANIQYNFIIQKTFKVCILSCQRASVPFSTGPGGKELRKYKKPDGLTELTRSKVNDIYYSFCFFIWFRFS